MFQKGQEEAPFQLLVAVILMTFVIIVGVNAMNEANKQKCFNDTEKLMNDFKLAVEKTANIKAPSNVNFSLPGCTKNEKFVIKRIDEARICSQVCLNSSSSCTLLRYNTNEVTGIQDKCINIGFDTQFRNFDTHPSQCPVMPDYSPAKIDSDQGVEAGVYQFLYYSNPAISYPVVCSYIKN